MGGNGEAGRVHRGSTKEGGGPRSVVEVDAESGGEK